MFGYVLTDKPELKIKEYEIYRAFYCGICKAINREYGSLPRLTLSYDAVFLAILLSSVSGSDIGFANERCIVHPVKKRFVAADDCCIEYAADINVLLSYLNLSDKWNDDRSLAAFAAMSVLKPGFKKILKKYPEKTKILLDRLNELAVLEKHNMECHKVLNSGKNLPDKNEPGYPARHTMDEAAEPFAKLMEEVMMFEPVMKNDRTGEILRWIGYNLGKWIYTIDAYDDLDKDMEKKSYNPLLIGFAYNAAGETAGEFRQRIKARVEYNLFYTLNELSKGFELLDIKANRPILENIIYLGMYKKTKAVLK